MPAIKEPRYFALDENGRYPDLGEHAPQSLLADLVTSSVADRNEYYGLFDGVTSETAIGEASPLYLSTQRAPARIRRELPDVRMVAVFRHPVELAYSAFMMTRRNAYEDMDDFLTAVPPGSGENVPTWRWRLYIEQALHGKNLQRFLSLFPREQFLFLLFDELIRSPELVYQQICDFLHVEPSSLPAPAPRQNVGYETRRLPLQSMVRKVVPDRIKHQLRSLADPLRKKKIKTPQELYTRYWPVFASDVGLLEELIETDLSAWAERAG